MRKPEPIPQPQHGKLLQKIAKLYEKLDERLEEVESKLESSADKDQPPKTPK